MLKLAEHIRSIHNRDGAVVLDIRHGQMFRLNFVGSRILELLKHDFTENQIVDELSREFGADRETVTADLRAFLAHLENDQLVEPWQPDSDSAR